MGVNKFLKELWLNIKTVAVEPAESPVMSGGEPGTSRNTRYRRW